MTRVNPNQGLEWDNMQAPVNAQCTRMGEQRPNADEPPEEMRAGPAAADGPRAPAVGLGRLAGSTAVITDGV